MAIGASGDKPRPRLAMAVPLAMMVYRTAAKGSPP
jgi:hypothetical protein